MKKKFFSSLLILSMMFIGGCNEQQIETVASQAGLYSVVTWIAIDNPDPVTIVYVKTIMKMIEESSKQVKDGQSYTEVVFPIISEYITQNMPSHVQPVVMAGSVSILGGIDLLFASNDSLKKGNEFANKIVSIFCKSALMGLNLKKDDPIIVSAKTSYSFRTKALN